VASLLAGPTRAWYEQRGYGLLALVLLAESAALILHLVFEKLGSLASHGLGPAPPSELVLWTAVNALAPLSMAAFWIGLCANCAKRLEELHLPGQPQGRYRMPLILYCLLQGWPLLLLLVLVALGSFWLRNSLDAAGPLQLGGAGVLMPATAGGRLWAVVSGYVYSALPLCSFVLLLRRDGALLWLMVLVMRVAVPYAFALQAGGHAESGGWALLAGPAAVWLSVVVDLTARAAAGMAVRKTVLGLERPPLLLHPIVLLAVLKLGALGLALAQPVFLVLVAPYMTASLPPAAALHFAVIVFISFAVVSPTAPPQQRPALLQRERRK
jgi:hypothetical protein